MKGNNIIGIVAISINLIAFFYKAMAGGRAGWEAMLPIVAIGLVLTIISIIIKRNKIGWLAVGTAALSVLIFLFG